MAQEFVHEALDQRFDQTFAYQSQLPWWPWVGKQFEASSMRTMLLGESVYDWSPGKDTCSNRYAKFTGLRISHVKHALAFDRNSAYVRNIERAFFNSSKPSLAQKQLLWESVVYHNLVLDLLPSQKHRPSLEQYVAGWHETLQLCETLAIERCVVYGVEWPKRQALMTVLKQRGFSFSWRKLTIEKCKSKARILVCALSSGESLKLVFIRHPSAFFSWRSWGSILAQEVVAVGLSVK